MKALGLGAVIVLVLLAAVAAPPTAAPAAEPVPEAARGTLWRSVEPGGSVTCGIRVSGRLFCWGSDGSGQLGNGSGFGPDRTVPVPVASAFRDWKQVSVGQNHACAIRGSGRLYCWGSDHQGQLGNGNPLADRAVPKPVAGGFTDWTSVAAGWWHTCARRSTGELFCWGSDGHGRLGNGAGTTGPQSAPSLVAGGFTDWTAVSGGIRHTCGRRATGLLYCWGADTAGALGDGPPHQDQPAPVLVAGGVTDWASVSVGANHACGRRSGGQIRCWGQDIAGQLGDGFPKEAQDIPVSVLGSPWSGVAAGHFHTCGRHVSGRLYCWGNDTFGQLGNGPATADRVKPVQVVGAATNWVGPAASSGVTCARKPAGAAFCWGHDAYGQLGDGRPRKNRNHPVRVR